METDPYEMTDGELAAFALQQWANRIETGDPSLTQVDCENQGLEFKALDRNQMELILRIRRVADRCQTAF